MSDLTKADIARLNGAKSHGPVTPEGKASSSRNALKHGLTAKTVCLANESQADFQEFTDSTLAAWNPVNEVECQLVQDMVVSKWAQQRYWAATTAAIDRQMREHAPAFERKYDQPDETLRMSEAIEALHKTNHLQLLQRYNTSLGNQYFRAMNQLIKIREKDIFRQPPSSPQPGLRNEPSTQPNSNIPNDEPPPKPASSERWIVSGRSTYVRETPKIGRNELCPCGSGMKFKKCCLDIAPGTAGSEPKTAA